MKVSPHMPPHPVHLMRVSPPPHRPSVSGIYWFLRNIFSSHPMSLSCCGHHDNILLKTLPVGSIIDSICTCSLWTHFLEAAPSRWLNMAGTQGTFWTDDPGSDTTPWGTEQTNLLSSLSPSLWVRPPLLLDDSQLLRTRSLSLSPFAQRSFWCLSVEEPWLTHLLSTIMALSCSIMPITCISVWNCTLTCAFHSCVFPIRWADSEKRKLRLLYPMYQMQCLACTSCSINICWVS